MAICGERFFNKYKHETVVSWIKKKSFLKKKTAELKAQNKLRGAILAKYISGVGGIFPAIYIVRATPQWH